MVKKYLATGLLTSIILAIILFSNISFSQGNEKNNPKNDTITLRTLHNELDTAGEWIKVTKSEVDPEGVTDGDDDYYDDDVDYEYVWRPHYTIIDGDWNPYYHGRWEWCAYGWIWVSYYSWGWLPYHYGRWWFSPIYGWVWSPGYTWAPCWVTWYWYDDYYYGWHPISPRHRWRWHHGGIVIHHPIFPHEKNWHRWTFVKDSDFKKDITKKNTTLDINAQKKILADVKDLSNKKKFENGPNVKDIEKSTGQKITEKKVTLTNKDNTKSYTKDNTKVIADKKNKDYSTNTDNKKNNSGLKKRNQSSDPDKKNKSSDKKYNGNTKKSGNDGSYNKKSGNDGNYNKKSGNDGNYNKKSGNDGSYNKKSGDNGNYNKKSGDNGSYNKKSDNGNNGSYNKGNRNSNNSGNNNRSGNNGSRNDNSKSNNNSNKRK